MGTTNVSYGIYDAQPNIHGTVKCHSPTNRLIAAPEQYMILYFFIGFHLHFIACSLTLLQAVIRSR